MAAFLAFVLHALSGLLIFLGSPPEYPITPFPLDDVRIASVAAASIVLLSLIGLLLLSSRNRSTVRAGAGLSVLVAIAALPTLWGVYLGSFLGLVAGYLGWTWRPPPPPAPGPVTPNELFAADRIVDLGETPPPPP